MPVKLNRVVETEKRGVHFSFRLPREPRMGTLIALGTGSVNQIKIAQ